MTPGWWLTCGLTVAITVAFAVTLSVLNCRDKRRWPE